MNNTRLRVCLFTDSLEPSGMGEHLMTLADELKDRCTFSLVCQLSTQAESILQRARDMGIITLPLELRGQSKGDWEKLCAWIYEQQFDVFHNHAGIGWEGHGGIYAAYHAHVPVIVRTEHLPYLLTDPVQRRQHADLLTTVTKLICVSEEARASFEKNDIPPEKLHTIRNGIHPRPRRKSHEQTRAQLGLSPNAQVVLTVGRMTEQKGHRYLLQAIPTVLSRLPDTYFVWAGQGPMETELRQEIEARQVGKHVLLLGQRNDVGDLLGAADLFVLPSLFEGLPLVVLEAMAANVPVVACRVCGTTEAIEDGVHGRLVEPKNPPALASAVIEALVEDGQTAQWRAAARLRFEQAFSAARMAHDTEALYRALIKQALSLSSIFVESNAYRTTKGGALAAVKAQPK